MYIRGAALDNLTDQNLLTDVAKNDKYYYVRMAAIKMLTDQDAPHPLGMGFDFGDNLFNRS